MLESNQELQTRNILNSNQFNCVRKIGKGGFGHVLLATKATSSSTQLAVKCLSKKKMIKDPLLKKSLIQEINTMASLEHPNIVKLYKTFEESDWYFLVLEYCEMGNLYSIQSKLTNKLFSYDEAVNIFNQILKGVDSIHKNKIIHRDLKLENIFLKKNEKSTTYTCKIGDFGLARFVEETAKSHCGTQNYMAPQILQNIPYSQEVDIWSLGVLFHYLLYAEFPFKSINILNQIYQKCKGGFKIQENNKIKNYFKNKKDEILLDDLFEKLFEISPSKRINIKQLRQHPALKPKTTETAKQKMTETLKPKITEIEESTGEEDLNQLAIKWEINQIQFIQKLAKQIQNSNFLSSYLLSAYKFYINKVILYFLHKEPLKKMRKDNDIHLKALENIQNDVVSQLQKLMTFIKNQPKGKEIISDFEQGFNLKIQDFSDFKIGYRNTIGKVYEQIHRKITQNSFEKASLKLKIFLCHIINRVFSGNYNPNIFPHFQKWMKKKTYASLKYYNFQLLEEWMREENIENLNNSQEIINKVFYK